MMLFVWFCVMTSAFLPGGAQIASQTAANYEAELRTALEAPQPVSSGALLGAARHIAGAPVFAR